jgi:hypothetical protein
VLKSYYIIISLSSTRRLSEDELIWEGCSSIQQRIGMQEYHPERMPAKKPFKEGL